MASNNLGMKTRAAARRKTRIPGTLNYYNRQNRARVVDLSPNGMALDVEGPFHASSGSAVKIESKELGILEGTVRWTNGGRIGVEFRVNSNAAALVAAYFRFFHEDMSPVLIR